jgi:hypothetical protein
MVGLHESKNFSWGNVLTAQGTNRTCNVGGLQIATICVKVTRNNRVVMKCRKMQSYWGRKVVRASQVHGLGLRSNILERKSISLE